MGSDQPQPLQTGVPVLADNDVVVHGNAERGGDIDDRLGHLDVRLRGVGSPEGWLCIYLLADVGH